MTSSGKLFTYIFFCQLCNYHKNIVKKLRRIPNRITPILMFNKLKLKIQITTNIFSSIFVTDSLEASLALLALTVLNMLSFLDGSINI
jgi:hypothetical protein